MKNLSIAAAVLIVVVVVIFLFNTKGRNTDDIYIPSQTPVSSPSVQIINQNQMKSNTLGKKTYPNPPSALPKSEIENKKAVIETDKGQFTIELSPDAPLASSNFIFLANEKFYDGLIFHRREEGFVIQGGDPIGNGTGGPGYAFADEPVTEDYLRGVVAMANAGPNTNGSQFFIMLEDHPELPKNYTIFGKVIRGLEVIDQIQVGDKILKATIE